MNIEISISYREDGTCDYVTVAGLDGMDVGEIAGLVTVLADREPTELGLSPKLWPVDPAPCGRKWVQPTIDEPGFWIAQCTLPAEHAGNHRCLDANLDASTDDIPAAVGICNQTYPIWRKGHGWVGDYVCHLRAGHMADHHDVTAEHQWPVDDLPCTRTETGEDCTCSS